MMVSAISRGRVDSPGCHPLRSDTRTNFMTHNLEEPKKKAVIGFGGLKVHFFNLILKKKQKNKYESSIGCSQGLPRHYLYLIYK